MSTMTSSTDTDRVWRRCNSCKKPVSYGAIYWVCNVSTCNRKRTGLIFCTVSCWDSHVPGMNHRESWAEENKAPSREEWKLILAAELEPKKRVRREDNPQPVASAPVSAGPARTIIRRKNET